MKAGRDDSVRISRRATDYNNCTIVVPFSRFSLLLQRRLRSRRAEEGAVPGSFSCHVIL